MIFNQPFEYDGAYHFFGEGRWGHRGRVLGSDKSGFHGHRGRPGHRGGSVARFTAGTPAMLDDMHGAMDMEVIFDEGMADATGAFGFADDPPVAVKMMVIEKLAAISGLNQDEVSDLVRAWAQTSNDHSLKALSLQEAVSEELGIEMSPWQKDRLAGMRRVQEMVEFKKAQELDASEFKRISRQHMDDRTLWRELALHKRKQDDEFESKYKEVMEYVTNETSFTFTNMSSSNSLDMLFPTATRTQERAFVRAVYDETQSAFAAMGFKPDDQVTLYRGVRSNIYLSQGSRAYLQQNAASSWSYEATTAMQFAEGDFTSGTSTSSGQVIAMNVPVRNLLSTAVTGIGCFDEQEVVVLGVPDSQARVAYAY